MIQPKLIVNEKSWSANLRNNPIQFAVVREDPEIETKLVSFLDAKRILLVGSGGCTAFSLASRFEQCELTLVDPNEAQLALVQTKLLHLQKSNSSDYGRRLFNIGNADPNGFNACGNFESLFRGFRNFIEDMVCPHELILAGFTDRDALGTLKRELFESPYWPVAFDMFFSDSLLLSMFGPEAIQHAPKGSYPAHFRNALTAGLCRDDAFDNYFLHHIFLGHYIDRENALPVYLREGLAACEMRFVCKTLQEIDDFGRFDLVHLSNVFDWMSEGEVAQIASRLSVKMRKGAGIIFRQLNHATEFNSYFREQFEFQRDLEAKLFAQDRSLFYSKLNIGVRR